MTMQAQACGNLTLKEALSGLEGGAHVCSLYERAQEQAESAALFIDIGLRRGEACLYIADDKDVEDVLSLLRRQGVDADAPLISGQLRVITKSEAYLHSRPFTPEAMIALLEESMRESMEAGFDGFRVTGEMTWVLDGAPGGERLLKYESELSRFLSKRRCTALCQYDRNRFPAQIIRDAILTHHYIIRNYRLLENRYSVPPEELASLSRESHEIDRFLSMLADRHEKEKQLADSEAMYRETLNSISDAVLMTNDSGAFTFVCGHLEDILGISAGEAVRRGSIQALLGEDIPGPADLGEDGEIRELEWPFESPSHGKLFLIVSIRRVRIGKGTVLYVCRDMTGRIRTQERLRASEERLRLVMGASGSGFFDFDLQTDSVAYSDYWFELLGYKPGELPQTYDTWTSLLHPDDRASAERAVWDWMHRGMRFALEFRMRAKDGSYRWILARAQCVAHNQDGDPLRVVGSHMDITEKKNTEQALLDERQKLETLLESIPAFVYLIAPDRSVRYANREFRERFGQPNGHRCWEILAGRECACPECPYDQVWQSKQLLQREWMDKQGRVYAIHDIPFTDTDGSPLVLMIGFDITARINIEESLRESEQRYRTIFEKVPDGIIITEVDSGRIAQANPAACRMYGYGPGELPGLLFEEFISQAGSSLYEKALKRLDTGKPFQAESEEVRKDGSPFHVEMQGGRVTWKSRDYNLFIIRDITENKRYQERIRQSEKMEAIGTLAGGIAHDFNNILSVVLGFAELAREDVKDRPEAVENLNEILHAGQRAQELVNQILTFSRRSEHQRKPLRLQSIVKEGTRFLRASIPASVEMHTAVAEDCGPVLADPTGMHQVLMNLCTNAYQSIRETGGLLTVGVKQVLLDPKQAELLPDLKAGPHVCLTVADTGCGIDATILNRIFEPYFTTKEKGEGTGLGLATVHSIVQAHDGAIKVESAPGQGTLFEVYLPVCIQDAEGALPPSIEYQHTRGHERILVIDDETAVLRVVAKHLSRMGYGVSAFDEPTKALDAFRAAPDQYDIVVSDMTMPKLSGKKLAEEILALQPGLPVILCTGYSKNVSAESLHGLGIHSVIQKPLELTKLAEAVRSALRAARS